MSSNIGAINIEDGELIIKIGIRSSDEHKLNIQIEKLKSLVEKYNFNMAIDANKPFFPFKEISEIRTVLYKTYKELFNKDAIIKKVHACMEGGVLSKNIPNLDICTIAPTIDECHSVNEKVSISSINRVYQWLKATLEEYNKN